MRFDTRMSTLCSGSPRSALRGHTAPVAMTSGPSHRSSTAAGMTIGAPRFRRLVPGLLYGRPESVAL